MPVAIDALQSTSAGCRCPFCREIFNSTGMFDRHRIGRFRDNGAHRRCLTPEQMLAKGYSKNASGYWIRAPHLRRTDSSGDRAPEMSQ